MDRGKLVTDIPVIVAFGLKGVSALRHKTESVLVGIAALAGVAFGLGRVLSHKANTTVGEQAGDERRIAKAVAESTARPTNLIGHPDSFATGYQTLVAIIEGVAFGALIASQNVIFGGGSISQHLTAAGQLITTLTVIAASTYEYLKLVRAVQWPLKIPDTTVPYLLGIGQVGMAISIGSNPRWWGSIAVQSFLSVWAFVYSRIRGKQDKAKFAGAEEGRRRFVSDITAYAVACAALFIGEAIMCALAVRHAGPGWLFVITPFISFPLFILILSIARKLRGSTGAAAKRSRDLWCLDLASRRRG
jgi:hypothetical protein